LEQLLYKTQIQKLIDEREEYRQTVQAFWIEQKQYKVQITKLTDKIYELEQKQTKSQVSAPTEEGLYKIQVQKLTEEKESYKATLQAFWI
jgi:hypothetical protein